jgi:hypothetical protein
MYPFVSKKGEQITSKIKGEQGQITSSSPEWVH